MRDKFDMMIVGIWQNTDDDYWLKKFEWFNDLAGASASRQLKKARHEVVKKRWQKVKLQNQLDDLKQKNDFAAENEQN